MLYTSIFAVISFGFAITATDATLRGSQESRKLETCPAPTAGQSHVCPNISPPGGLNPEDIPQFVVVTFDDSVRPDFDIFEIEGIVVNGCEAHYTLFTEGRYNNYDLVNGLYTRGHEIAAHSMTHETSHTSSYERWVNEIYGSVATISSLSYVPEKDIRGFRAPYLAYSTTYMQVLHELGMTYDSSIVYYPYTNEDRGSQYWPYSMDYGTPLCFYEYDCSGWNFPDLWEFPLYNPTTYPTFDNAMDFTSPSHVPYLKDGFMAKYYGNRAPFGIWTHDGRDNSGIRPFLEWLNEFPDTYVVTMGHVLDWMRNPVDKYTYAANQMCATNNNVPVAQCVPTTCPNGVQTCGECPTDIPTIDNWRTTICSLPTACYEEGCACAGANNNGNSGGNDGSGNNNDSGVSGSDPNCPAPTGTQNHICASTSAPGGLSTDELPQFVLISFDDAVNPGLSDVEAVKDVYVNDCRARYTLFTLTDGTDYSYVHELYKLGHEIAGHTMSHQTTLDTTRERWLQEIKGTKATISTLAGIPEKDIRGFREPTLSYSTTYMDALYESGIQYDASLYEVPVSDDVRGNMLFPYTLDYGSPQDCHVNCRDWQYWGMFEFPLSGPWTEIGDIENWASYDNLERMKDAFLARYNGNKAPFTIATYHSADSSGIQPFLEWLNNFPHTYVVTMNQYMSWMQAPVDKNTYASRWLCLLPNPEPTRTCEPYSCPTGITVCDSNHCPSDVPAFDNWLTTICSLPAACHQPGCACQTASDTPTTDTGTTNGHPPSYSPPNGMDPQSAPMFVVVSFDDAVNEERNGMTLIDGLYVNECPVRSTIFTTTDGTNYGMIHDWYMKGHEIAVHTLTHSTSYDTKYDVWINEINGCKAALSALAHIPESDIRGIRAPYLQYSTDYFNVVQHSELTYDASMEYIPPSNNELRSMLYPYTMDNGTPQKCEVDCLSWSYPGLWQFPLWMPYLGTKESMDWISMTNLESVKWSFLEKYNGNRCPFGVWTHHARDNSGLRPFLEWLQQFDDVYVVTMGQVIDWMENPVDKATYKSSGMCYSRWPNPTAPCNKITCPSVGWAGQGQTCGFCPSEWIAPNNWRRMLCDTNAACTSEGCACTK